MFPHTDLYLQVPEFCHDRIFQYDQIAIVRANVATSVMELPTSDSLDTVNLAKLHRSFTINTFGPFLLTRILLPNISLSPYPHIAVLSSRVGSIGDNSFSIAYSYRASKAVVNALFKSLAVDPKEKGTPIFILLPGIVKTNLDGRWKNGSRFEVQSAVEPAYPAGELRKMLMEKGLENTGKFFHRSGEELPW